MFLVAQPASAQSTQLGNKLKIVILASQGSIFMDVFSPMGFSDVYTIRVRYFLSDPAYVTGPDAKFHNYRCELVSVQYNVKVPADAIIWNGTQKKWVAPYAGKTAQSAVTWKCGLGKWQDGQPVTLADILFNYAMDWEWSYQDGKNDKYYNQKWAVGMQPVLKLVLGLKVDKVTDQYVEYTLYQNYAVPYDKWTTAVGNAMWYTMWPWELYYVMDEMVVNGVNGKTFDWTTQPQNGFRLNMIDPNQAPYFAAEAEKLAADGTIPIWLSTLKPWLQKWGITEEQAGITTDLAKAGYQAIANWAKEYKNAYISNGPYYLYKYDPKAMTLVLKLSDKVQRIGFPDKINGQPLPWDPYWKEVDIYGTLNAQTALLAVAKGDYALYWYNAKFSDIQKILQEYKNNVYPVRTISTWDALQINDIGDQQTGLVNSSGKEVFNVMALRGVRYALQWLVNRQYIVSQILQGSGAPMFGPEVSGQANAYQRIMTVANAMGLTPQGDEQYALKLIDQAMNKAAQNLKAKGYVLEKKDGKWYFGKAGGSLSPVTVNVIARVEDERLDIGKYTAQLLEKAGFTVNLLKWNRVKANKAVYNGDPHTLQWQVYTAGFVSSGIQPLTWIVWDYWAFDYYYNPSPMAPQEDTYTVKDLVNAVSNGDLNKFIQEFNLKYYNTPDKLKPLLDWNGYQLDNLLAFNSWKGPNNQTLTITSLDQLWDIYKIAYGLNIYNSPFVYLVETWTFYLTNKKLIKLGMTDPVSGLGSFLSARAIMPATTQTTTTSTSSTSTSTVTHTSSQTSTNTATSTQAPTSSTTTSKSSKGICGPAAIVGLAIIPLLLRRRK
ncbi:CGP-CTERM sorting domain-containing protein [Thermococcus henrietii]